MIELKNSKTGFQFSRVQESRLYDLSNCYHFLIGGLVNFMGAPLILRLCQSGLRVTLEPRLQERERTRNPVRVVTVVLPLLQQIIQVLLRTFDRIFNGEIMEIL